MYQYSPVIHEPAAAHVHHILVYLCANINETQVGASQECVGSGNIELDECRQTGIIFAAWAVGGSVSWDRVHQIQSVMFSSFFTGLCVSKWSWLSLWWKR